MTLLIEISNRGPEIASTNYWATENAQKGLCYLTANAGTLRLLLPEGLVSALAEMRTGRQVLIERSLHPGLGARCVDLVFDDGTDSPYAIAIDKNAQVDRGLANGRCRFAVWTEAQGKVLELPCIVKL